MSESILTHTMFVEKEKG